ncbi:MAG: DUF2341 domain-containing protein, partial [Candidatus Parvarchaeota archaeon]|nr:DUF2341 domain-containing protein [Candidatus Parvarchaeum tengchongense]
MKKAVLIALSTFIFLLFIRETYASSNWLGGWTYRVPINITERSGNNLIDYQVLIELNTRRLIVGEAIYELPIFISSVGENLTEYPVKIEITDPDILRKIMHDGRDIRIFNKSTNMPYSDTEGLLPFWIQEIIPDQKLIIWVKVPNIPESGGVTLYMYYGNSGASSIASLCDYVFVFCDDFRTAKSVDTNKWIITEGTSDDFIGIFARELEIRTDTRSPAKVILTKNPITLKNAAIEYKILIHTLAVGHTAGVGIMNSSQAGGAGYWPMFNGYEVFTIVMVTPTGSTVLESTGRFSFAEWYNAKITKVGNNYSFYINDQKIGKTYTINTGDTFYILAPSVINNAISMVLGIWIEYIFVRPYSSVEPSVSFGNERLVAPLSSGGKMRSDCSDIRFTDSDGVTLLNYWIEPGTCNTTNTKIWVKVNLTAFSNKTIYLYYGNPKAISMSYCDSVFLICDDFLDSSLNSTRWINGYLGTAPVRYSISEGVITLWSNNTNAVLALNYTINPEDSIIVEFKLSTANRYSPVWFRLYQFNNLTNNSLGAFYELTKFQNMVQTIAIANGSISSGSYNRIHRIPFGEWYIGRTTKVNETTFELSIYTQYRDFIAKREVTNSRWASVKWIIAWLAYYDNTSSTKIDWIIVRKYASSEPVFSFGIEEIATYNMLTNISNFSIYQGRSFNFSVDIWMFSSQFVSVNVSCPSGFVCTPTRFTVYSNSTVSISVLTTYSALQGTYNITITAEDDTNLIIQQKVDVFVIRIANITALSVLNSSWNPFRYLVNVTSVDPFRLVVIANGSIAHDQIYTAGNHSLNLTYPFRTNVTSTTVNLSAFVYVNDTLIDSRNITFTLNIPSTFRLNLSVHWLVPSGSYNVIIKDAYHSDHVVTYTYQTASLTVTNLQMYYDRYIIEIIPSDNRYVVFPSREFNVSIPTTIIAYILSGYPRIPFLSAVRRYIYIVNATALNRTFTYILVPINKSRIHPSGLNVYFTNETSVLNSTFLGFFNN